MSKYKVDKDDRTSVLEDMDRLLNDQNLENALESDWYEYFDFYKYVRETWINENSRFPPKLWRTVEVRQTRDVDMTKNIIEGYHRRLGPSIGDPVTLDRLLNTLRLLESEKLNDYYFQDANPTNNARVMFDEVPPPESSQVLTVMTENDRSSDDEQSDVEPEFSDSSVQEQPNDNESRPLTKERRSDMQRNNLYSSLRTVHNIVYPLRSNTVNSSESSNGLQWNFYFGADN
eukprot:gb/GECH01014315.1/.p1 GENE.gb/GECH01014315.1/~~gb/GECH01014315.1/.p1  ORF type:complete len:231 (+),score=15.15 gb/GECH01014315.1/:1-693(+)